MSVLVFFALLTYMRSMIIIDHLIIHDQIYFVQTSNAQAICRQIQANDDRRVLLPFAKGGMDEKNATSTNF